MYDPAMFFEEFSKHLKYERMPEQLTRALSFLLIAIGAMSAGCSLYESDQIATGSERIEENPLAEDERSDFGHAHAGDAMGSAIASFGGDNYHAEALVEEDGSIVVFVLGSETTELCEVPQQQLTAYVRAVGSTASRALLLSASPSPEDALGHTCRFSGNLPGDYLEQEFTMTVPGLRVGEQRYLLRFPFMKKQTLEMPEAATTDEAQELYLTDGGIYTEEDIVANGRTTAREKYADFVPKHDPNPQMGDWVCPITKTKANPECSWIIGGETYFFCCPPCIDEFLGKAKSAPGGIGKPSLYRQ